MAKWPWIERTFNFDYPASKFPDIMERVRGTPARVAAMVEGVDPTILVRRDEKGWSLQENVGHLADVHALWIKRIDEFLAGAEVLTAADMSGGKTRDANHNARQMKDVLDDFRRQRDQIVARFDQLGNDDWARSALHPRLNQPMRMVDQACFIAEHDDYHLARMRELIRQFT